MDRCNDSLSIMALVNSVFIYEKPFGQLLGFSSPTDYEDSKIIIHYNGNYSHGEEATISIRDSNETTVFKHTDGVPGCTTIFRHGAWEDYLEALPERFKKMKPKLEEKRRELEALNFSDIDDAEFFAPAKTRSKNSVATTGWEMP